MKTHDPIGTNLAKPLEPERSWEWDVELDSFVARLEKAYATAGQCIDLGKAIRLIDFVPDKSHPQYAKILCELIRVDMELSAIASNVRTLGYYQNQFSELFEDGSIIQELEFEQQRIERIVCGSHVGSQAESFPAVGETICGFELQAEVGRGSFSRVYLALEQGLANRRVVLKISSQFLGEAELLSRLQHQNIVPIYSLHRHSHWHVVCMPMLGTTTLNSLLKHLVSLDKVPTSGDALVDTIRNSVSQTLLESHPAEVVKTAQASDQFQSDVIERLEKRFKSQSYNDSVLRIVRQLAEGLSHAHDRKILHRDIKPANVLISDDGVPMLLDFNLAVEDAAQNRVWGGTPRYMAPESQVGRL